MLHPVGCVRCTVKQTLNSSTNVFYEEASFYFYLLQNAQSNFTKKIQVQIVVQSLKFAEAVCKLDFFF